ncbi:MAG: hypothetical protein ACI909_004073 [Planctomycetota bacterium]|jgi:hypothetical protein
MSAPRDIRLQYGHLLLLRKSLEFLKAVIRSSVDDLNKQVGFVDLYCRVARFTVLLQLIVFYG